MSEPKITLKAILDASGIGKADIAKIQKQLDRYLVTIHMEPDDTDFLESMKEGLSELSSLVSNVTGSLDQFQKLTEEAIGISISLDELRSASSASSSDMQKCFNEACASAKRLGASVNSIINATTQWSLAGYSLPDAKKLAEAAALYKNISSSADMDTATGSLASTLAGFQLGADDAMHVIDSFSAVESRFQESGASISKGLGLSAHSLHEAGNSLEESIGLIAAAAPILQSPDDIAATYEAISLRLRGAREEMENLGIETDGMAATATALRQEMLALSGVDIIDGQGTFKPTYQVLDELASKWQGLSKAQQESITNLVAGSEQKSYFSSLMSGFDAARLAADTATNSTGAAQKAQEEYEQSIQSSLGRLEASFQSFAGNLMDSDFLKGIMDFGTGIINVMDAVTDKIGTLSTAGIGLGIAAGMKNTGKRRMSIRPS